MVGEPLRPAHLEHRQRPVLVPVQARPRPRVLGLAARRDRLEHVARPHPPPPLRVGRHARARRREQPALARRHDALPAAPRLGEAEPVRVRRDGRDLVPQRLGQPRRHPVVREPHARVGLRVADGRQVGRALARADKLEGRALKRPPHERLAVAHLAQPARPRPREVRVRQRRRLGQPQPRRRKVQKHPVPALRRPVRPRVPQHHLRLVSHPHDGAEELREHVLGPVVPRLHDARHVLQDAVLGPVEVDKRRKRRHQRLVLDLRERRLVLREQREPGTRAPGRDEVDLAGTGHLVRELPLERQPEEVVDRPGERPRRPGVGAVGHVCVDCLVPQVVGPDHVDRPALFEPSPKVAAAAKQVHPSQLAEALAPRVEALPQRGREIAVKRDAPRAAAVLAARALEPVGDVEQVSRASPVVRGRDGLAVPKEAHDTPARDLVRLRHNELLRVHELVRRRPRGSGVNLPPAQQSPQPHEYDLALLKDLDHLVRLRELLRRRERGEHRVARPEAEPRLAVVARHVGPLERHPPPALDQVGLPHKELPAAPLVRAPEPVDLVDAQDLVLLDLRLGALLAGAVVREEELVRPRVLHHAAGRLDGPVEPRHVEAADAASADVHLLDEAEPPIVLGRVLGRHGPPLRVRRLLAIPRCRDRVAWLDLVDHLGREEARLALTARPRRELGGWLRQPVQKPRRAGGRGRRLLPSHAWPVRGIVADRPQNLAKHHVSEALFDIGRDDRRRFPLPALHDWRHRRRPVLAVLAEIYGLAEQLQRLGLLPPQHAVHLLPEEVDVCYHRGAVVVARVLPPPVAEPRRLAVGIEQPPDKVGLERVKTDRATLLDHESRVVDHVLGQVGDPKKGRVESLVLG